MHEKGFISFKEEDEVEGVAFGPMWIEGKKQQRWARKDYAIALAQELDLEFEEV